MNRRILAIETSCDETAIATLNADGKLIASCVASQAGFHQKYGGVVPEYASRMHTEVIHLLIEQALSESNWQFQDIQAIAVTKGPGLEGSLLIGISAAKAMAGVLNVPLVGVNHLHGHLYSPFLSEAPPEFPFVGLIVSGGHTILVLVTAHFEFEILGATRDDAAGEAYDKVARLLGLKYPGGPQVEIAARTGDASKFVFPKAHLPGSFDFSFSGLKSSVARTVKELEDSAQPLSVSDICAGFQKSVIEILLKKSVAACEKYQVNTLMICGGVSINQALRDAFQTGCDERGIRLCVAPPAYCTDNAAMIGIAAWYYLYTQKPLEPVQVRPNLGMGF